MHLNNIKKNNDLDWEEDGNMVTTGNRRRGTGEDGMLFFEARYLSQEHLKGFEKYKYSSLDTSPLSKYVMHPFWNQTVKIIPEWVAPNLLTFMGFLFVLLMTGLIAYYDPWYGASSDSIPDQKPIPQWVWLACAIFHFLAHTLDGIDGKQARRTGSSGPLGELFDHGLDSWTSLLIPFCIYSVFGRADYSFPPIRVHLIFWSVFITFYLSHWEKYNTGILYLPWSYDVTQITLLIMYLISFWYGHSFWKFTVYGFTNGNLFEIATHMACYMLSIPVTVYNVNHAYRTTGLKYKSWSEVFRPLIPFLTLFAITVGWSFFSPNDVVNVQPRLFFLLVGTIFSNIACRLIVSQMSSTRCEVVNWLLVPLASCVGLIFLTDTLRVQEVATLKILCIISIIAHLHYGFCVVRQMARHFHINVFSLSKKKQQQDALQDRQKLLNDKSNHH